MGFEPTNKGFADLSVRPLRHPATASVPRPRLDPRPGTHCVWLPHAQLDLEWASAPTIHTPTRTPTNEEGTNTTPRRARDAGKSLERERGIEPPTSTLARLRSTPELLPPGPDPAHPSPPATTPPKAPGRHHPGKRTSRPAPGCRCYRELIPPRQPLTNDGPQAGLQG